MAVVREKRAKRILVLGGSGEGFALAGVLDGVPGLEVISSFAGRTQRLRRPAGGMRVGGFGGAAGLAAYLRRNAIDAVVDATHPFARQIKKNAARAGQQTGTPVLHLLRPPWTEQAGDFWLHAATMEEAAALVPPGPGKVLLTVGRGALLPFAARSDVAFIARVIEAAELPRACRHFEILRARGPFHTAAEILLLQSRGISAIVAKNSGGDGARAKLEAARALGLPVILVARPNPPRGEKVQTVGEAVRWLSARLGFAPLHIHRKRPSQPAVTQSLRIKTPGKANGGNGQTGPAQALPLNVVGVTESGWEGLSPQARQAIAQAKTIMGSKRQIGLIAPRHLAGKTVRTWPSPLFPALERLLENADAAGAGPVCLLASGDPMLFGIGASLRQRLNGRDIAVHPQVSSVALACARLGWDQASCRILSLCGRPLAQLHRELFDGVRLLLLGADENTPGDIARLLVERGFGASRMQVLGYLGGPRESRFSVLAKDFPQDRPPDGRARPALNVVAVSCVADPGAAILSTTPGLAEDVFRHDGQISKAEVRAITLAALSPRPDALLWDIGAGSGAVGIEWMRAAPRARAFALELRADRVRHIRANAQALGVPDLRVIQGRAPGVLRNLPAPDAIFVGGGTADAALLAKAMEALKPGGRLVANGVTLEAGRVLSEAADRYGGTLIQIAISRRQPLGSFSAWKPARPVIQWRWAAPWEDRPETGGAGE